MPAGMESRVGVLIEWEGVFRALGSVCSDLEFVVCPLFYILSMRELINLDFINFYQGKLWDVKVNLSFTTEGKYHKFVDLISLASFHNTFFL